jgi:hypothetical protein
MQTLFGIYGSQLHNNNSDASKLFQKYSSLSYTCSTYDSTVIAKKTNVGNLREICLPEYEKVVFGLLSVYV